MSPAASHARIAVFAATVITLAGCSGKRIRLGDGTFNMDGGMRGNRTDGPGGSGQSGMATDAAGSGGASGAATCSHADVKASEVLWIGDSWVLIPGTQRTGVRDRARAAGAIGPTEDYANLGASAANLATIAQQYDTQEAGPTKVKVLLMDGGTWDTLTTNGSQASVTRVAAAFTQFLAHVASDGTVEHIVYFLMPELPTIAGVAALRPLLQKACAESSTPCHFLDLQPLWTGHPDYTAPDGIQASAAGGTVIADNIWSIMQKNCIAQ